MIKNLIFDLGGVIINIDFDKSAKAFINLGINNFQNLFHRSIQQDLFAKYEIGFMNDDAFRNELRAISNKKIANIDIDFAWNAMLLDFPQERLELLLQLKNKYRIFLLSNTNSIHFSAFQNTLREKHQIDGLESIFHKTYFSHLIHLRKPNAEAYQMILNEQKIDASETLFIDDAPQNIKGAMEVGLKTLWIDNEKDDHILNHFNKNGLI